MQDACPSSPDTTFTSTQEVFRRIEDEQYLDMSRFYRRQGGLASADEVTWRMARHWDQPISVLDGWIVRREVVNIVWRFRTLVPMFQFTPGDMRIRPVVGSLLAELRGVFDDWEIADWLMQPNAWLQDERPLNLLAVDGAAVVGAARADRFIVRG